MRGRSIHYGLATLIALAFTATGLRAAPAEETCAPARSESPSAAESALASVDTPTSEALRELVASANAVRADLRALAGGDERAGLALRARTAALGARTLAQPAHPLRTRVLLHLATSMSELLAGTPRADGNETDRARADAWLADVEASARAAGDQAYAAHARLRRARLQLQAGRAEVALALARGAALGAARAPHQRTLASASALVGELERDRGRRVEAIDAYRSAVEALETLRPSNQDPTTDRHLAFRRGVAPTYAALTSLLIDAARDASQEPTTQALLGEARATVERLKQAELRDHFRDECLIQASETTSDRIPGTVVVHPVVLPDRLELIVSREGRLTAHRVDVPGDELEQLARRFRIALEDRTTRGYRRLGATLYDRLIRPIEGRLAEGPVDALVFVPDGALRQIPIGALWDEREERFLIERLPVAITPSLELTEPGPLPRERIDLLAGGLTQAVQGFVALPSVASEIDELSRRFPTVSLVDEGFLTARYEQTLRERPFDLLHVASHAEFSPDPSDSYILTWDGRLSLERLGALLGQTRFRTERPVELLVLSACETAVGDDRSALGLAGVAVRTGARSVVATLWSINDFASSKLVTRFYAALAEPGTSRAEALRRAQRSLIDDPGLRHPANWAGFLLINSWL